MQTIIQYIFIAIVFIIAVVYVIRMVKNATGTGDGSCATGCGKCDSNPENTLKKKDS